MTRAWVAGVAALTAAWVAVALSGGDWPPGDGSAGPAVAAGATAVVGAAWLPRAVRSAVPAGATLLALPLAAAAAVGGSSFPLAAVTAALAGGEVVDGARVGRARGPWLALLVAGSAGLAVAAAAGLETDRLLRDLHDGRTASSLPGAGRELGAAPLVGAGAGACLLLGAGLAPPRPRPLAVAGLVVGLASVAQLPGSVMAPVLCAGAVAVALVLGPARTGLVLGLLAMAAGAVPGALVVAVLLAAAAVLALALDHPAALALALPGAAALAQSLVAGRLGASGALLGLAAAAAGLVLASRARAGAPAWTTPATLPALALAAWLVLLPGSWAWAAAHGLSRYDRGAVAAAVGGTVAVVVGRTTRLGWRLTARDRDAVGVRGEGGEGAAQVGARAMVTSSTSADGHPS